MDSCQYSVSLCDPFASLDAFASEKQGLPHMGAMSQGKTSGLFFIKKGHYSV